MIFAMEAQPKQPYTDLTERIINGDAREVLPGLAESSIDCIVTSPPYFRQRDYADLRQIGREESVADYITNVAEIFDACRRILKSSGTFWLNVGDKYEDEQLLGIPWRLALALQERGWILRSDIIWHKPNAMPHSVKTRPTTDHEYLFFFSKGLDYFYDTDAIREPHVTFTAKSRMMGGRNHFGKRNGTPEQGKNQGNANLHDARWDQAFHPKGRNKRTVWSVSLSKYRGAHFAVFPEKLIEPCILAGCPRYGVVLDPFLGSGTVAVVASRFQRGYIGIELNPEYVKMAEKRLYKSQLQP